MRTDARAMSLKARVRNRAAALGLAPHVVLQNYMFGRFLVRLAASPWRERFVLKGGLLIAHLHGLAERATMDMDATVRGFALTADSASAAVADVCAVDAGDGIAFSVASGEPIRQNDPYGGFRIHFDAAAFGIRVHLSVDLSTGDAVTPAPEEYELPGLFDDTPSIRLLGYSRETILAEKIESILTLSVYGTRPRDYYDLWLLSGDAIRPDILRDALRATCRHRGTEARLGDASERLAAIATSDALLVRWNRYREAFPYAKDVTFEQTIQVLRKLLALAGVPVDSAPRHLPSLPVMNRPATPMDSPILLPRSVAPERWGYLRPDGSWAMPPQFAFAWPFSEGVAAVRKGDRMGYLRPDGSEALPFRYLRAGEFEKGRSEVETETGMGVIRPDGSFVLEPRFEFIWRQEWKGIDVFRTDGKDGRHALYDFDGNLLLPPRDGDFFAIDFGLLAVEKDGRWGIAAEDGRFVVPPEFENIDGFDERGWSCAERGPDGPTVFFDREGRIVLAPDVDYAAPFFDDFAAARRDGKWGAIDREGRTVLPFRFDGVNTFSEGLFPVFKAAHPGDPDDPRGEWSFVRSDGEPVFLDRFETASPFDNGIAWCEAKGGRWGPFLREGRFLVPPIYDDPGWESGPFLSGWKSDDELENWFDRTGRIIVPAAPEPHAERAEY